MAGYGTWVYSGARSVEKMLDRADTLDVSGVATGNNAALVSAQSLVDESTDAVDSFSGKLGPVRVAEAVFGWVPWAGDQLRAPDMLLDRADAALLSTEPLIAAADDFFRLRDLISNGDLTGSDEEFDRIIRSLESNSDEVSLRMERVNEASVAMSDMSLLGVFDKRTRRVTSLENRLLAFGAALAAASPAIADARTVLEEGSSVTDLLNRQSSDLSLQNMATAVSQLAATAQNAESSINRLAELVAIAAPGSALSRFSSNLSLSTESVVELSAGLATIVEVFEGAAEILGRSEGSLLTNGDDLQRALQSLVLERERLAESLDSSGLAVVQLNELIASGGGDFLPAGLTESLVERTMKVLDAGNLMLDGPELLLSILGAGSPKKYMVLGQTSDELRAAGGFTSSVWTLSFESGALIDTEFIPVLRFENRNLLAESPGPPEPLSYYMNTGAMYLRDVGWEPDYTAVASLATDLYRLHQREDIDGVIAVTQWGIIKLVDAIGGIEVAGEFVSPDETLAIIEQGTDTEGTEFLERLFTALLESLEGSAFTDPEFGLIRTLSEIISQKDVMLFSSNEQEQHLIDALKVGGRFPVDEQDRLGVVDSNVGWSKSDRSIERSAKYVVDLSLPEFPKAELTLSYRNTGSEIGRDCSSQRPPIGSEAIYSVSQNSCYWNYLRAYVATGIDVTESPDFPLPVNSVPGQLDRQAAGTPTFLHGFDEYGDYLAGLVTVPPGDSVKFSFEYELPASVLLATDSGFVYELALVAQSGARGRNTAVELQLPEGYSLGFTNHAPESTDGASISFQFDLLSDQVLRVELVADA